jgi:two-component system sensor histidine kinase PrrB
VKRRLVRMLPRSLRVQLTASVALLVMCVVGLAGLTIALRIDHRDRSDLDRQMTSQAEKVRADVVKLVSDGADEHPADDYGDLLQGSQSLVRLLTNGRVLAARGDQPGGPVPPAPTGLSTVTIDGQPWRSLIEPVSGAGADQLQILQSLQPLQQQLNDNGEIALIVAAAAAVIAAGGAWLVAGLILRPLQRLRAGAVGILAADTAQLPRIGRPREVADLSATLNTMLDRLQTSMTATRRFTADAGHELRTPLASLGMNLETLARNPLLPAEARDEILAAMGAEHLRLVSVLDGLQALARGDAAALPGQEPIDLIDLVTEAVAHARRRHPAVTYHLRDDGGTGVVSGWPTGLRLAIDNLLDNAALHGRPSGEVIVSVTTHDQRVHLTVADDGDGIPADLRETMTRRFTRGADPRGPGSGLGLALVEQQAHLHAGALALDTSPAGGLSATVSIPAVDKHENRPASPDGA